jgi:hypothetical protein
MAENFPLPAGRTPPSCTGARVRVAAAVADLSGGVAAEGARAEACKSQS